MCDLEQFSKILSHLFIKFFCYYTAKAELNYLQLLLDVTFIFTLLDFAKRSFMVDKDVSNIKKLSGQPKQKKEQQPAKTMTLQVEVILNKPRIALLEDASKLNSRAIVLEVR